MISTETFILLWINVLVRLQSGLWFNKYNACDMGLICIKKNMNPKHCHETHIILYKLHILDGPNWQEHSLIAH